MTWYACFSACKEPAPQKGPHRWQSKHIEYYLNREANVYSETAVRGTFEKWGEKSGITFEYKGRHHAGIRRDDRNTISFMLRWPKKLPMGKVGYCKTWYDKTGNIIESDIIFNMQITRFTTLQKNTKDAYYVEGVLAHEIGHMLGLDHINSETSIMKEKSSAEESYFKGEIDEETLAAFRALYAENGLAPSRSSQ